MPTAQGLTVIRKQVRMSREDKALIIEQLQEAFSKCEVGIFTDYRGLTASEINSLRNKLRGLGVEYKVVKNTLARFAVVGAGKDELVDFFEGPVAIAFGHGEITEPAKALADYINVSKVDLSVKGGFLGDRILTAKDVMTLSTLPSREILLAKLLGGMQAPVHALLSHLNAPVRGFMAVLQARIQQLEEG